MVRPFALHTIAPLVKKDKSCSAFGPPPSKNNKLPSLKSIKKQFDIKGMIVILVGGGTERATTFMYLDCRYKK